MKGNFFVQPTTARTLVRTRDHLDQNFMMIVMFRLKVYMRSSELLQLPLREDMTGHDMQLSKERPTDTSYLGDASGLLSCVCVPKCKPLERQAYRCGERSLHFKKK